MNQFIRNMITPMPVPVMVPMPLISSCDPAGYHRGFACPDRALQHNHWFPMPVMPTVDAASFDPGFARSGETHDAWFPGDSEDNQPAVCEPPPGLGPSSETCWCPEPLPDCEASSSSSALAWLENEKHASVEADGNVPAADAHDDDDLERIHNGELGIWFDQQGFKPYERYQ